MAEPAAENATEQTQKEDEQPKAPVFGAAFGTGGFAAFTGVAPTAPKAEDGEGGGGEEDEECNAEFTPLVQLEEVEVNTGEENEDLLCELKCKLYRFDREASAWKERGTGQAKFLQNRESKKIRFLMRQDKTLKIRANHFVVPGTKMANHNGNEKAWVWSALDFADQEQKLEMFAIRFGSLEKAQEFKEQYEKAMKNNEPLLAGGEASAQPPAAEAAADAAAEPESKAAANGAEEAPAAGAQVEEITEKMKDSKIEVEPAS